MIIITLFFLLLPIGAFVFFWLYALKRNWRYIRLLSFTVSLSLWLITLILWVTTGTSENWIFGVGTTFSVLVGLVLLSLPVTAPEIVSLLDFKWWTNYEKVDKKTELFCININLFICCYWLFDNSLLSRSKNVHSGSTKPVVDHSICLFRRLGAIYFFAGGDV